MALEIKTRLSLFRENRQAQRLLREGDRKTANIHFVKAGRLWVSLLPDRLLLFRVEKTSVPLGAVGEGGVSSWIYFDAKKLPKKPEQRMEAVKKELGSLKTLYGGKLIFTTLGELRATSSDINYDYLVNPAAHYGGAGVSIAAKHDKPIKTTMLNLANLPAIRFSQGLALLA